MIVRSKELSITGIDFPSGLVLSVHLSNDRIFTVPLVQFPAILHLTEGQRNDFEIIDGAYLSFLAIDEVYSLAELIGLENIKSPV